MQKIIINHLILIGLMLLSLSQTAFAGSYKIEVLVFAHKQPSTEIFDQTTSTLKPPLGAIDINVVNDPTQLALSEEPLTGLGAAYDQLSRQADYDVLLKKAWIQSINPYQPTPAAHIETASKSLNGYISLITDGAMTMQVDIEYMPAIQNQYAQVMNANPVVYRLTEKRPLKFNESHYFDHPAIGVILLVTPL